MPETGYQSVPRAKVASRTSARGVYHGLGPSNMRESLTLVRGVCNQHSSTGVWRPTTTATVGDGSFTVNEGAVAADQRGGPQHGITI